MRRGSLLYYLVCCIALASSAASEVKPLVALDIGHTINHPGAYSARGVGEYYFNKKIVKALHESLRNSGKVDAVIINPEGKPISLQERTRRATERNADLFLSVHHDSVQPRYLKKWEVNGRTQLYSDKFKGFSIFFSRRNPKFAESFRFARLLGEAMISRGFSPTWHHAEQIPGEGRNLVDGDLGLYQFDDLIVLKTAAMPAALLECGIIVNRDEEASLQTPEIQHRIADAGAEAIMQFFHTEADFAKQRRLNQP
jgi:N-acetylmuramoyl-L-alanine amidase